MRRRPEARLETDILLAVGADPRVAIYKNEVGRGYYGTVLPALLKALPHAAADIRAVAQRHRVVYGLGVGSPDLVAIGVGACLCCGNRAPGAFVGLELKAGSSVSAEQLAWHEAARARGAVVEVVRSLDEARRALGIGGT